MSNEARLKQIIKNLKNHNDALEKKNSKLRKQLAIERNCNGYKEGLVSVEKSKDDRINYLQKELKEVMSFSKKLLNRYMPTSASVMLSEEIDFYKENRSIANKILKSGDK